MARWTLIWMFVALLLPQSGAAGSRSAAGGPTEAHWRMYGDSAGISFSFHRDAPLPPAQLRLFWMTAGAQETSERSAVQGQEILGSVFPGVDVVMHGRQGVPEFDFAVAPHADPGAIAYRFEGATSVNLLPSGDLQVVAAGFPFLQRRPLAWQDINGVRHPVAVSFALQPDGEIRFDLGAYRRDHPLVIDPTVEFSSNLAANATESFTPIQLARAPSGDYFLLGFGGENSLPAEGPAHKPFPGTSTSLVLARIDGVSYRLLARTFLPLDPSVYLPGNPAMLVVDSNGSPWVISTALSTVLPALNPPIGGTPISLNGNERAFLVRLNPEASEITYSAYLGCTGSVLASSAAAGATGDLLIAGSTRCADFPVTAGAYQTARAPSSTAAGFVLKLNAATAQPQFATYLGSWGPNRVYPLKVASDSTGRALIGSSVDASVYPVTPGTLSPGRPGAASVYLGALSADGKALEFGTHFGGSGTVTLDRLAVGPGNAIYLAGDVRSGELPLSPGAFSVGPASENRQFIARISANGQRLESSALVYRGWASLGSLTVLADGDVVYTGQAYSGQVGMSQGAYDRIRENYTSADFLIARLSADGTTLRFSSTFPSTGGMSPVASAAGAGGKVLLVGKGPQGVPRTENAWVPQLPATTGWNAGFLTVFDLDSPVFCSYSAASSPPVFPAGTSSGSLQVTTQPGCPWVLRQVGVTISEWGERRGGIGTGSVSFTLPANLTRSERNIELDAGSATYLLRQAAGTCDLFEISHQQLTFTAAAASDIVRIATPEGCPWTGGPSTAWFANLGSFDGISEPRSFSGPLYISAHAYPNSFEARSGVLPLGPYTLPITQAAGPCTSSVSPSSLSVPKAGGEFSIQIQTTGSGCIWQYAASPGVAPLVNPGTGPATIPLRIEPNPGNSPRQMSFLVANKTIPITQAAGTCSASFESSTLTVPHVASVRPIRFNATGDACLWNTTASASWISFQNAIANGSATLWMEFQANPGPAPRTATIRNLGATITITQSGNNVAYVLVAAPAQWPASINGQPVVLPYEASLPLGTELRIEAAEAVHIDETLLFRATRWDDGVSRNRTIVLNASDTRLNLEWERLYRVAVEKVDGGTLNYQNNGIPVEGWPEFFRADPGLGQVFFSATPVPEPGYRFSGWVANNAQQYDTIGFRQSFDGRKPYLRPRFDRLDAASVPRLVPSRLELTVYPDAPQPETMVELIGVQTSQNAPPMQISCDTGTLLLLGTGGNREPESHKLRVAPNPSALKQAGAGTYKCIVRAHAADADPWVSSEIAVHVRGLPANNPAPPPQTGIAAVSHAATFIPSPLAPGGLFSAFGLELAAGTASAPSIPLPLLLSDAQIRIYSEEDFVERIAELLYVSPQQINFYVPQELPLGRAKVRLYRAGSMVSEVQKTVQRAVPGVFYVPVTNGTSPAGYGILVSGNQQLRRNIYTCQQGTCTMSVLDFGAPGDELFLSLFGTGLRALRPDEVAITANGTPLPVTFIGAHPLFVGLDQMNVKVPRSLLGSGEVFLEFRYRGSLFSTERVRF